MKRLKNILIIFICFLMLCGFKQEETSLLDFLPTFDIFNTNKTSGAVSYPSTYDSRNYVDTFNNQANEHQSSLSICWAFASNNVVEAYLSKVKGLTTYTLNLPLPQNSTEYSFDLSENQAEYAARYLWDISSFGAPNSTFNIVKYWFYNITPITQLSFDSNGYFTTYKSKELKSYMNTSNVTYDIRNVKLFNQYPVKQLLNGNYSESQIYYNIGQYNNNIKEYIYNYGAVMGIIHTRFLTQASSGQYGWVYNNGSLDESTYSSTAHAITLIGWDDNYVWSGANAAPYKGAWLAANSWGSNTTYFYVSYFDASIVKGSIGVSKIELNNGIYYNKNYLVGESKAYQDAYVYKPTGEKRENRERFYTRTNIDSTTDSFTYYIGDDTEKLDSVKLLFLGFNNSSSVVDNLNVKIEVIGSNDSTYTTVNSISPGITRFSLRNIDLVGNVTVKVTITNPSGLNIQNMYYAVELFTKNSNTSKKLFVNKVGGIYTNKAGGTNTFDVVSKNIDPTESSNISVQVLDASNSNITSKFTITKSDLVFDSTKINLLQNEALSTNSIKLKVTVDGTTVTKTYSTSIPSYVINEYTTNNSSMTVSNVAPNTTVATLLSNVIATSKTVLDRNNVTVPTSNNVATGYKLRIVSNGNTVDYGLSVTGDVNGDGDVDVSDAAAIRAHAVQKRIINNNLEAIAADTNKDSEIDISDSSKIIAHIVRGVSLR